MADAPAATSPPAPAGKGEPASTPSAAASPHEIPPTVRLPPPAAAPPRELPPTVRLPPPPSGGSGGRGARRAPAPAAAGGGGRDGRRKIGPPASAPAGAGAGGRAADRLVEAVTLVGKDLDAGVAGADILELAMAKGPMFSWLSFWPEEGFPKEDHPY